MKAQIRNWQTTLVGVLLAALITLQEATNGKDLADWKAWVLPVSIAALGFLARDAGRSTEESTK